MKIYDRLGIQVEIKLEGYVFGVREGTTRDDLFIWEKNGSRKYPLKVIELKKGTGLDTLEKINSEIKE